jgi:peroxiredoxin
MEVPAAAVVNSPAMNAGDLAPDFELPADDGSTIRLSDELKNGPVVLFFYPRALTPGCTAESCHFRDLAGEFASVNTRILGISADPVDRQQKFTAKHDFGFPLLSDSDRSVARAYGVKRPGPLFNRRMTFVIGTDRRLLAVLHSETKMEKHADEALEALQVAADGTRR